MKSELWQSNAQFLFSSSKASLTQMAQLAASISLQLDFLPDKSGGHGRSERGRQTLRNTRAKKPTEEGTREGLVDPLTFCRVGEHKNRSLT